MAGSDNIFWGSSPKRRRTLISMRETKHRALPSFFEIQSEEDVLDALEAIKADVTLGRPVRWRELLPVIRAMTVDDETTPECLSVAKALLGLFERYHCRDMRVKSEVFRLFFRLTDPDHLMLNKSIDFTKIFFSPYGEGQTKVNLVFRAVKFGNLGLLKLQLKFGLGMTLNFSSGSDHIYYLLLVWPYNFDMIAYSALNSSEIQQILSGINNEMMEKNIRCNFNSESVKRLNLILGMMDLVREMKLRRPDCRERFAECYRLLFESIPAAFVTSIEVKASFEKFLPASCSPLISRITEDFKNLLPDLAEVPQPRSLQHLCRIQVRQSLRRNRNLPHGVSSLPLPTSLKKYIMLDDDGDYSFVIRSHYFHVVHGNPDWYINSPERDDCVTSFIKNL